MKAAVRAVRPYVLAGIVLVGAAIVIAIPLRPSIPQVEVPATQLSTETLPFDTGNFRPELEILIPSTVGPDGLDIDAGAGQMPIIEGFDPTPLEVEVFPTPQDYASMIGGVVPGPNDLFPGQP